MLLVNMLGLKDIRDKKSETITKTFESTLKE